MCLLLKFCISYIAFLLHQRSRYDGLNLREMLSVLLLYNELPQNNLSARSHLVTSMKAQKRKQVLGLWCWTAVQKGHVEMPDISSVFFVLARPVIPLYLSQSRNLFKCASVRMETTSLPHANALNFIHIHSPICSVFPVGK